ncbi:MAG: hypothetical protein WCE65_07365 [Methanoregula sp.]
MPKRIDTGTPEGEAIGFSGSLFSGWLELYDDCRIYLYYIISRFKDQGNTQILIRRWLREGYDIRIVMPCPIMRHIIGKFGFEQATEYLPAHYDDEVEVWRRPSSLETHTYSAGTLSMVHSR